MRLTGLFANKKTPCELGRIRGELNVKFQVPELYHTAESAGFAGSAGTCVSMSITGDVLRLDALRSGLSRVVLVLSRGWTRRKCRNSWAQTLLGAPSCPGCPALPYFSANLDNSKNEGWNLSSPISPCITWKFFLMILDLMFHFRVM